MGTCALWSCAPIPSETPPQPPAHRSVTTEPVMRRFAFTTLDGKTVSSGNLRGRMTLVVLLATYDDASQAQARFVKAVLRSHAPRINALAIAMEPPQNLPLVRIFADSLDLPYPVALADADTLVGAGPFPGLDRVPSLLLLDRDGREVWRHSGVLDSVALSTAIAEHDRYAR